MLFFVFISKVSDSLDSIDEFLKTCEPVDQKDLYMQLIKGVDSLYQKICNDGNFRTNFEKHFKCIQGLHTEFEDCNGPADWNEDMEKEKVCKAYADIVHCYSYKTENVCGDEAAHLMRDLSKAVVGSVLTHDCPNTDMEPNIKPVENIEEPEPNSVPKPKFSRAAKSMIGNGQLSVFVTFFYVLLWFTG